MPGARPWKVIKKQEEKLVVETTAAAAAAAEAETAAALTAFRPWEKVLSIAEPKMGWAVHGARPEPKKAFLAQ